MKTIYNTYIEVKSQKQAYRLKQICIDNNLPIWDDDIAFDKSITKENEKSLFSYTKEYDEFYIIDVLKQNRCDKQKVTESEWLELLKQHKCTE